MHLCSENCISWIFGRYFCEKSTTKICRKPEYYYSFSCVESHLLASWNLDENLIALKHEIYRTQCVKTSPDKAWIWLIGVRMSPSTILQSTLHCKYLLCAKSTSNICSGEQSFVFLILHTRFKFDFVKIMLHLYSQISSRNQLSEITTSY